jgi:phenylalanyl-tRNA synthetase alpha chain
MADDLVTLENEGIGKIHAASSLDALRTIEKELFGRKKGMLTAKMQELKGLSSTEKIERGAELNTVKERLEAELKKKRASFEGERIGKLETEDALDLTMDLPAEEASQAGHLHLIPEFLRQVEEVFGRMGFEIAEGPELEEEYYIFDAINFPKDHPARDVMDTFWLKPQEKRRLLRCHLSSIQARHGEKHKPPFRILYRGKCFRKDADTTHSPMFHQLEAMMVGKDISLRHLKGVMTSIMRELIAPNIEFRFRASYFPFTEPSMEVDMRWKGNTMTKEGQWMEVAGCGMVHPNVLKNCGIDPNEWQGFAFAFGIERLLMIKHQIPNIRLFYHGDLRFLRQW